MSRYRLSPRMHCIWSASSLPWFEGPVDPIDQFLWAGMTYANSFNPGDEDRFRPGGYLTHYWTDESIKIIEGNRHRRYLLYLTHRGVHTPLQPTREDYTAVGAIQPHRLLS